MPDFDPYFDYNTPCEKHIAEIHTALAKHYTARDGFLADPSRENFCQLFESWDEVDRIIETVKHEAYTIPVMVHVAGEKKQETNPNDETQEGIFQRCTRCGSVLSFWHDQMGMMLTEDGPHAIEESDIPWWKPGTIVAKTSQTETSFGPGVGMYAIEPQGRELHRHEMECVNLSELSVS